VEEQMVAGVSPTGHKEFVMHTLGMMVLALATFAALLGFVALCDRV